MKGVHITLRMRLECRIVRRGASVGSHEEAGEVHEVLNEVVVDRGANPYLAKIECWERDTLITKACCLPSKCVAAHEPPRLFVSEDASVAAEAECSSYLWCIALPTTHPPWCRWSAA